MKSLTKNDLQILCRDEKKLVTYIGSKLSSYSPKTHYFSRKKSVPAGVLLPLFFKDGQAFLLFTKRTETLEHHKGQISFPGGKWDNSDNDLLETTLRETKEEIGVRKADIEILGQTDRFQTNTYFLITPFVGVFPHPYPFTISEGEIERLIEVPLLHLMRDSVFSVKPFQKNGITWQVHYYQYKQDTIWGVTGFLLSNFLSLVFGLDRPLDKPETQK